LKNLGLVWWLLFCFAASCTGFFVSTDGWYEELHKPAWNPPTYLFGPVWSTLYVLMAIAAWLVWREGGWKVQGWRLRVFVLQWVLNVCWTPLFFALHKRGASFVEICLLWAAIVLTIWAFWGVRRLASVLLIPYLGWVSFAAALNYSIWRLNM
jgi:tryptophan-rich sensory protein